MNLYKEASFYTNFFSSLNDFFLEEDFFENDSVYWGKMSSIDTIYPLIITIKIPIDFPHRKLSFLTNSISGYPHLISNHLTGLSWFCLNTPFAEDAENQLLEELSRLRGWIKRFLISSAMSPDLDFETQRSLTILSAHQWINKDELKDIFNPVHDLETNLVFLGDSFSTPDKLKRIGELECIANGNFYIATDNVTLVKKCRNTVRIPYLLLDEAPKNLNDLNKIRIELGLDDDLYSHLLGNYKRWVDENVILKIANKRTLAVREKYDLVISIIKSSDISDSLKKIALKKLYNEIQVNDKSLEEQELLISTSLEIAPEYKKIILNEINLIKKLFEELSSPDYEEDPSFINQCQENRKHVFAFGIRGKDNISWITEEIVYSAYNSNMQKELFKECKIGSFDFSFYHYKASIWPTRAFRFSHERFFGRGRLCDEFIEKKIAIIGLGAVGATLAESLIRSGINYLSLWDGDKVEIGNICRSNYNIDECGEYKVSALSIRLQKISPFCKIDIHTEDLYSFINYKSRAEIETPLNGVDLIIDCTASNELLHFLSFSLPKKEIISLCITNKANNLICCSNHFSNIFYLRKYFLGKIEQDSENYYEEGTGCCIPTFLANDSDIKSLVYFALKNINKVLEKKKYIDSFILSIKDDNVVKEDIQILKSLDLGIQLTVSSSLLREMQEYSMAQSSTEVGGYLLGGYDKDGRNIYLTEILKLDSLVPMKNGYFPSNTTAVWDVLSDRFERSNGLIGYIGEWHSHPFFSSEYSEQDISSIAKQALSESISTNNPLLCIYSLVEEKSAFYLYYEGNLYLLKEEN